MRRQLCCETDADSDFWNVVMLEMLDVANVSKEPYILLKEPYILSKEPYILSKEPYILSNTYTSRLHFATCVRCVCDTLTPTHSCTHTHTHAYTHTTTP